jgi:Domain of unknown function (DU1801)
MLPEPPEYLQFIACYPPAIQQLHREARKWLLNYLPPVIEIIYDATQTVTMGFSFTEKTGGHFIHLPISKDHVRLGFTWGVKLHDPEKRLIGDSNQVRHIKLFDLTPLDDPTIQDLINQAIAQAPNHHKFPEPRSIIKVMNGPKRRPQP